MIKLNNEVKNIFLHDTGKILKIFLQTLKYLALQSLLKKELIKERKMFLINGQIISSKKNNKVDIVKF